MTSATIQLTIFGRPEAKNTTPNLGSVKGDRFATFTDLEGRTIRCTSGHLWVTLENDVMDHILRADQSFTIPVMGKVIIGGKGDYRVEQSQPMPLAS